MELRQSNKQARFDIDRLWARLTREYGHRRVHVPDYTLTRPDGDSVALYDFFAGQSRLLILHHNRETCRDCNSVADSVNVNYTPIGGATALVLIFQDHPEILEALAAHRKWSFRIASSFGTSFDRQMGFGSTDGGTVGGMSALVRDDTGDIFRVATANQRSTWEHCSSWLCLSLLPQSCLPDNSDDQKR